MMLRPLLTTWDASLGLSHPLNGLRNPAAVQCLPLAFHFFSSFLSSRRHLDGSKFKEMYWWT